MKFSLSIFLILVSSALFAKGLEAQVNSELGYKQVYSSSLENVKSTPYLKSEFLKKFGEDFSSPSLRIAFRAQQKFNEGDQEEEVSLRNFLFEKKGDHYALDWGLQNISWSETFGFNILDLVNPRDWSEYVFEDLSWSQKPVWALKTSLLFSSLKIQFIYVPQAKNPILPKKNSFYDPIPSSLQGLPREEYHQKKVFNDAEGGLRLNYLFDFGLDLSLMAYHHFNRTPFYYLKGNTLSLSDERLTSYGTSFTYAYEGAVFRGDTLWTEGQTYADSNLNFQKGNEVQGIYGLDYTFENQFILGVQYQFAHLTDNHWGALQLKKSFASIDLQALFFFGLNNSDRWLRPEFTWHLPYDMSVRLYYDSIYGQKTEGVFGPLGKKNLYGLNWNWLF